MEKIFLQFGEAANCSLVHLWNYFSLQKEQYDGDKAEIKRKFYGNGNNPKTLIYSEKLGLKGIISQGAISDKFTSENCKSEEIINQKTGRWTDFNYGTEFPESSYRETNQFDPTRTFLSSFYDSKGKSSFLEDFENDTRKIAESCDWLECFNFVSEGCGAIGASTLHALEHLNDEYTKTGKIVLSFSERIKISSVSSIEWENCDKFDGEEVGNAIKLALNFNSISDQNVTFIPIESLKSSAFNYFGDMKLWEPKDAGRIFSALCFDIFGQQAVPCKGKFASLMVSTDTEKDLFNLSAYSNSNNCGLKANLTKLRKVPIVFDESNYKFDWIDLITFADFSPKLFAVPQAEKALKVTTRPRPIWQLLESAGVSDELAAGDYFQELRETLYQIVDDADD